MDLVVERHGRLVVAVEIKSRKTIAGADLSGLRSFASAHPGVPCFVTCQAPEEHRLGDVTVLPWQRLLPLLERAVRG